MGTHRIRRLLGALLVVTVVVCVPSPALGQARVDWEAVGDRAVELLRRYVRLDTTNPPGNEILAAEFFARLLADAGIEAEVFESLPGRGNVVARLRGDGSRGGHVVLLNHMDVVPASPAYWSVDPYEGVIRGGKLYGRGVTDMKADGVVQLLALIALKESGVALGRDVVFMGTAAEETGGAEGAGFIVKERPDLVEGVEFVLTEGGGGRRLGSREVHAVEFTQKTPLWLRLVARGPAGHGSRALEESAANRLVRALERIRTYKPPLQLVPSVAETIRAGARLEPDPFLRGAARRIDETFADPAVLEILGERMGNLLRSTIAITVIEGSTKTNVISPSAYAELDCRLLPGTNADLFIATLLDVIDDPAIEIETILRFDSSESPRDTTLWRAIEEGVRRRDPEAVVLPSVLAGFTDSHYFREEGIVAYGWSPVVGDADDGPAHGVDERIDVQSLREAPRLLYEVLELVAARREREPR